MTRRFTRLQHLRVIELPADISVETALHALREDAAVLYAEPDYLVRISDTPDDPSFPSQWGLSNSGQGGGVAGADIDAPAAWDLTTGSDQIVVGVLDTGLDYTHPDLAGNVWSNPLDCDGDGIDDDGNGYADDCHGIDVWNEDSDPQDDSSHGTHVSGTIAAVGNNGLGISGVAWQAKLIGCKFLSERGEGYVSGAIECLDYLAVLKERGVGIVATNNSWGGFGFSNALREAIEEHMARDILFVAAAGNSFRDHDAYPVFPSGFGLPNVIAVAATDPNDGLAGFSDDGRHSVDLGAPGAGILSTVPGGAFDEYWGTSMAAPHVTGVAALIKAADPGADWRTIRNRILAGGDDVPSLTRTVTGKRLNAFGALTCSNSIVRSRLAPAMDSIDARVGEAVELSALHIDCTEPAGAPVVFVEPGSGQVPMADDGVPPDVVEADGVYSGEWAPEAAGTYEIVFPGDDRITVRALPEEGRPFHFSYKTYPGLPSLLLEALAVGDVSGDGLDDVVVANSSTSPFVPGVALTVFLQSAAGGFEAPVAYHVGDPPFYGFVSTVAIGDLNGDMRADVAFGGRISSEGNVLGVFYQRPDGTLGPAVRIPSGRSQRVAIGDLNHDGRADLLAGIGTGGNAALVDVFLQDPSGGLQWSAIHQASYPHPVVNIDLAIADVGGDGLGDIVVLGHAGRLLYYDDLRLAVLRQEPGGSFSSSTQLLGDRLLLDPHSLGVGDLDGDGLEDIAVSGGGNRYLSDPYVITFLQDGTGSFAPPVRHPAYELPDMVEIVDVDMDGRNDVVTAHPGWGAVGTFFGTGVGTLHPYVLDPLGGARNSSPQALAVGDLNSDGKPDLAFADLVGSLHVLYNQVEARGEALVGIFKPRGDQGRVVSHPPGIDCGPTCDGYTDVTPGCAKACRAFFPSGARVTLEAVPVPGARFDFWEFCEAARDGTCTFSAGGDHTIWAHFDYEGPRLTVELMGAGAGIVRSEPTGIWCGMDCSEPYPWGDSVTLVAEPGPLSSFVGWGSRCPGTGPCTVALNGAQSVEAWFHLPIILRGPAPAATYHSDDSPAAFEWHPGTGERFRVLWSANPSFGKSSLSSGKAWLQGEAFMPDADLWEKVLRLAKSTGTVYWKVVGRDSAGSLESSEPGTILVAGQEAPGLTMPADGQVFSAQDPAPTLTWEPNHNAAYRVVFSWRPDLKGKPKVASGEGYTITGGSWTVPDTSWERIKSVLAPRGNGTVHYAILAKDSLGRTTRSATHTLRIQ